MNYWSAFAKPTDRRHHEPLNFVNDFTLLDSTVPELPLLAPGKVRDIYDVGDALLIVATDRISCFGVVLPPPQPTLTAAGEREK